MRPRPEWSYPNRIVPASPVPCRTCGAAPFRPCRTAKGLTAQVDHQNRLDAAIVALMEERGEWDIDWIRWHHGFGPDPRENQ